MMAQPQHVPSTTPDESQRLVTILADMLRSALARELENGPPPLANREEDPKTGSQNPLTSLAPRINCVPDSGQLPLRILRGAGDGDIESVG